MINLLDEVLPDYITVAGVVYTIRSDFRTWIRFEQLLGSMNSKPEQIIVEVFKLCFKPDSAFVLPPSFVDTMKALLEFYAHSEFGNSKEQRIEKSAKAQRIYSFADDADYIYSAFMQQYHIDLCQSKMHWWKFKALFSSLTDDTKMGEIMQIRAMNLDDISDKKQRAHYRKLKQTYALPDLRSEEEKENDLANIIDAL